MRALLLAVVIALGLLPAGTAGAADELQVIDVDTSAHPQVTVTIALPRSAVAGDVDAPAVRVVEGGAQRDASVSAQSADALDVVLLLDASGSMQGEPLAAMRSAATSFLRLLPAGSRAAAMAFGSEPVLLAPFSADLSAATAAIARVDARGETALYDAVTAAAGLFADSEASHRVIVLLSDGGDTASSATVEAAAAALGGAGTTLYAIELRTGETDTQALNALAAASQGKVVPASDPAALEGVYAQVAGQLTSRYVVAYRSEAHGPTTIRVTVDAVGGVLSAERTAQLPAAPEVRPTAPTRPVGQVTAPGWLASRWALVVGAASVYAALALLLLVLLAPRERRTRLSRLTGPVGAPRAPRRTAITDLAERAVGVAETGLRRRGWHAGLNRLLERAGLDLRPGELVVLVTCTSLVGGVLGAISGGQALAVLFASVPPVAVRLLLGARGDRRSRAFAEQLPDTLQLLSGSLRAGYGLLQAVDSVAREAGAPTGAEFRRLLLESRLGRDLGDSLAAMAERLDNDDFEWVVQAIGINREVGGDLADVLDTVAGTIREREQIRRQIRALSAEGRLSAYILLALPFFVGTLMFLKSPDYPLELVRNGVVGLAMVGIGAGLMLVGTLWMKRIVRLEF